MSRSGHFVLVTAFLPGTYRSRSGLARSGVLSPSSGGTIYRKGATRSALKPSKAWGTPAQRRSPSPSRSSHRWVRSTIRSRPTSWSNGKVSCGFRSGGGQQRLGAGVANQLGSADRHCWDAGVELEQSYIGSAAMGGAPGDCVYSHRFRRKAMSARAEAEPWRHGGGGDYRCCAAIVANRSRNSASEGACFEYPPSTCRSCPVV